MEQCESQENLQAPLRPARPSVLPQILKDPLPRVSCQRSKLERLSIYPRLKGRGFHWAKVVREP